MTADPWRDQGGQGRPEHPAIEGVPLCPTCGGHEQVQYALGRTGGYWCGHCNTQYTAGPGEWAANAKRRELWAREYEREGAA